ncbi:MAG TPA: hypothetical protein VGJ84_18505 [Polyangiaceae bacterium]|jgi:hypothetical protein
MKRSVLFRSITLLLTGLVLTAFSGCGTTPGKSVAALCEEYVRALCDLFINCYKEDIETVLAVAVDKPLKKDMDAEECWNQIGDVDPDPKVGSKRCPAAMTGSICSDLKKEEVFHQDRLEKCIGQVQTASQKCPEGHFFDYAPACHRNFTNESGVEVGICGAGCQDQIRDGDETDVDCGGTKCDPCSSGSTDAASTSQDSGTDSSSAQDSASSTDSAPQDSGASG